MPKIKINDINIHYQQSGKGPDLVLIAGFAIDHMLWGLVVPELQKHFRVLVFDNRGVGQTDAPDEPYSIKQMADDTAVLMDALNVKKAHVVGSSMGGMIAQQLALHHADKVDRLVLVSTGARQSEVSRRTLISWCANKAAGLPMELCIRGSLPDVYSDTFLSNHPVVDMLVQAALNNPYPQTDQGRERQLEACISYEALDDLHRITHNTLVVFGEEDILLKPKKSREIADAIPNAELLGIPSVAHLPMIESPDRFVKLVKAFLT